MKIDWFEMWFEDKQNILNTMVHNMASDLEAGYDYFGNCIQNQKKMIDEYKAQFDAEMDSFYEMDDAKVQRWCYYNMKKRGVIS